MTLKQEPTKAVAPRRAKPKSRGEKKLLSPFGGEALSFLRTLAGMRVAKPQDEISSVLKNDKIRGKNKKIAPFSLKSQGKRSEKRV
ncbi:hypothetical protein [Corynebacterium silvaticum]|uniref:Uncharacterized protein n=1 Tax=Corynebacterium silvaticum TaxID=2320431 RepID=A0A7U5HML6_9CORY|nr:hypothetical protein [Corynebacterium silvaticum]ARU46559.2 hypothetical protein CBE74_08810 [Corynebacterium silvaticum]MBH5299711.1 hypothetical protein [Corynebacterium silvaticum]NOM63970.1 hypothetical protein [Corynebacterium silvaticum]NON69175.1 hypothetical protein [Corynebacterium silvaticum]TFA93834.1 hypothetical protein EU802_00110 [Corynebacterium silvaticum]